MPKPSSLVVVQAHPSREDLHLDLVRAAEGLPIFFSLHSSSPPNPWAGYEQALRSGIQAGHAHLIVLQDDAIPCEGFPRAVAERIAERPDSVLSLWVGALRCKTTTKYQQAMIAKESWSPIYFRDIHHVVGLVWPRHLAEEFLEWAGTSRLPGENRPQQSDDAIFGAWARRTHQTVWACVPSLIEHNDDVESTIGRQRGDRGRRAIYFVDSPAP